MALTGRQGRGVEKRRASCLTLVRLFLGAYLSAQVPGLEHWLQGLMWSWLRSELACSSAQRRALGTTVA